MNEPIFEKILDQVAKSMSASYQDELGGKLGEHQAIPLEVARRLLGSENYAKLTRIPLKHLGPTAGTVYLINILYAVGDEPTNLFLTELEQIVANEFDLTDDRRVEFFRMLEARKNDLPARGDEI